MVNQKNAFWKALLLTLIIFIIGFSAGFFVENSRTNKVQMALLNSEVDLLDAQLKDTTIQQFNISCDIAKESTFNFADKIYGEALKLEKYDSAAKLGNSLTPFHKRYDLLRVLLWNNAIALKNNCNGSFHTVVFLYDYNTRTIDTKAKQLALSNLLLEFKYKHGDKVLLIPIVANLDIESVNLIMKKYNITDSPAIIIDEKTVIRGLINSNDLENIVFNSNNE